MLNVFLFSQSVCIFLLSHIQFVCLRIMRGLNAKGSLRISLPGRVLAKLLLTKTEVYLGA